MKKYFIYLTTNLINGKRYIGKHYGLETDNYLGSGKELKKDIELFGKENFQREILCYSENEEENCRNERLMIAKYNAIKDNNFYNIHEGGAGGNMIAGWSLEEKQKLHDKLSIKYSGEGNPRYGVHLTEETKNKIRANRDTSYMKTEEYRQTMSKAVSGEKNGMYGKKHSEESKRKMSEHSIGKTSGEKNGMYGKKGNKALNGKKVFMLDQDKNIIQIFNAKTAVLEFLGVKGHTQLDNAIKNQTIYKNYYWSVETK